MASNLNAHSREPWNKGKIVGQKAPFRIKDIWALRVRLQMESRVRELALFNLGIDSKLRGCDLVSLRVRDVCHGDQVADGAGQHQTFSDAHNRNAAVLGGVSLPVVEIPSEVACNCVSSSARNRPSRTNRTFLEPQLRVAEEKRDDLQRAGFTNAVVAQHCSATARVDRSDAGTGNTLIGAGIHKERATKAVRH